jgi:hypothetical protein
MITLLQSYTRTRSFRISFLIITTKRIFSFKILLRIFVNFVVYVSADLSFSNKFSTNVNT